MMDPMDYNQTETLALQTKGSVPSPKKTTVERLFLPYQYTTKTMMSHNNLYPLTPLPYLFPMHMVLIQSYYLIYCIFVHMFKLKAIPT